ncbi:conserved hypothetical protein [delta proteobacterium NaphS2]|nr:conserved hypothetical protein [delta proteobacterium NaphS2]
MDIAIIFSHSLIQRDFIPWAKKILITEDNEDPARCSNCTF